ncbi:MAG: hypothetical protein ABFD89_09030 [Bryobacteraceae bacterium]
MSNAKNEPVYVFSAEDAGKAAQEWGANCGPMALAMSLGRHIREIRGAIPGFDQKGYTSPTMMAGALSNLGVPVKREVKGTQARSAKWSDWPDRGLVRIQWSGPWTAPGTNGRWAYCFTHWVASLRTEKGFWIFDCNTGWSDPGYWILHAVPAITQTIKRADGGWFATHLWELG